jgi:hypothetical protein
VYPEKNLGPAELSGATEMQGLKYHLLSLFPSDERTGKLDTSFSNRQSHWAAFLYGTMNKRASQLSSLLSASLLIVPLHDFGPEYSHLPNLLSRGLRHV